MAHPRQVGKEGSKTRHQILDAVEDLMVESGHAAVTYRSVATRAGVVASNVQYYFPTLDDLLVAAVRRRTEQSLQHLIDMLNARPDHPLRVLWEFGSDETTAALAFEFSALGNHHESVRAETVKYMNRLRGIQLGALSGSREGGDGSDAIPAPALLFLLTGIPKLIRMEADFEVDIGHRETVELVERFLDTHEPS
jgi:TetR/AcrR family transcriptional regulator, transcriptional repressor for nem operon